MNGNSDGIRVHNSTDIRIKGNSVKDSEDVGIRLSGRHNTVQSNTASGNGIDLFDIDPDCGSATWKSNTFGTSNRSCISE